MFVVTVSHLVSWRVFSFNSKALTKQQTRRQTITSASPVNFISRFNIIYLKLFCTCETIHTYYWAFPFHWTCLRSILYSIYCVCTLWHHMKLHCLFVFAFLQNLKIPPSITHFIILTGFTKSNYHFYPTILFVCFDASNRMTPLSLNTCCILCKLHTI